jgi:hypothetical protein
LAKPLVACKNVFVVMVCIVWKIFDIDYRVFRSNYFFVAVIQKGEDTLTGTSSSTKK